MSDPAHPARLPGMRYTTNKNELAKIFATRFVNAMIDDRAQTDDASVVPSLASVAALWPAFLDTCVDLELIDEDAATEWAEPPRGVILDELRWYSDFI